MKATGRRLAVIALVIATIGCDRVTKHLATVELAGAPRQSFLADTVRLQYEENAGAFLSLGAGLPDWARLGIFVAGTGLLLAALGVALLRRRFEGRDLVGLCLIWAGGVSNLVDRVDRGTVVDFLNVGVGPVRTGVFNVADLAIATGVVFVLLRGRETHGH
jgi:signal peptidase II